MVPLDTKHFLSETNYARGVILPSTVSLLVFIHIYGIALMQGKVANVPRSPTSGAAYTQHTPLSERQSGIQLRAAERPQKKKQQQINKQIKVVRKKGA